MAIFGLDCVAFAASLDSCDCDEPMTLDEEIADKENDLREAREDAAELEKELTELKDKRRQDNLAKPGHALWGEFWRTCSDEAGTIHDGYSVKGRFLNRQAFEFLNRVVADAKASEREASASYLVKNGYDLSAAMIRNQK